MALWSRKKQDAPPPIPQTGPINPVKWVIDPSGAPAVDLAALREAAEREHNDGKISLAKNSGKAGISLSKGGLQGVRLQVTAWYDHSVSMRDEYKAGTVDGISDLFLAWSMQVDVDHSVPTRTWDYDLHPEVLVTPDNFEGIVARKLWHNGKMGGTNLAPVAQAILDAALVTDLPLFAGIITDGKPNDEDEAIPIFNQISRTSTFVKVMVVDPNGWPWAKKFDEGTLPGMDMFVDNVNAVQAYDPANISPMAWFDLMTRELGAWSHRAIAAESLLP
jgi:hypothetical protein